ncbi:MAG: ImmA/IrrE family metallo-endopeptidase [Fimbriimonadaceae bacterium]|nr:ImmA/IrrE family metallo-endopeptidase [Fimbriimonadaceae bacterium]QYK57412.1 MAG: ImmA/IrrE family metallo-endopeptidase [Fimbriimonadaceae bacterium]
MRVAVHNRMLEWAVQRAGQTVESFIESRPHSKLDRWLSGEAKPTLKQLEQFAGWTHTSVGLLLLPEPLEEPLPIADFRGHTTGKPSANLLDTIYLCQQRQDWYREHARLYRLDEVGYVGSATRSDDPEAVAARLRPNAGIAAEERAYLGTWEDARRELIRRIEATGALVMVSGVVGSNSHRRLDTQEFRGFSLAEPLGPVIFVNGTDTKAAQIFTLAHELGHLCLGESALSDSYARLVSTVSVEDWCNRFAAEFLVPKAELETMPGADMQAVARRFKVSTLVALRRLFDIGRMTQTEFWSLFDAELERLKGIEARASSGGDFYNMVTARAGRRLARAIVMSTLEGQASFTESVRLLGFKKMSTFYELARRVGVES